jgi:hypothetical protein
MFFEQFEREGFGALGRRTIRNPTLAAAIAPGDQIAEGATAWHSRLAMGWTILRHPIEFCLARMRTQVEAPGATNHATHRLGCNAHPAPAKGAARVSVASGFR